MFILTNTSHCVDGFSRFGSFETGYAPQTQTQMIRPVESTHGGIGGKKDEDGNDKRKIPTGTLEPGTEVLNLEREAEPRLPQSSDRDLCSNPQLWTPEPRSSIDDIVFPRRQGVAFSAIAPILSEDVDRE
ncbi:hypothetical protein LOK49_LG15G02348 [Camellia lanceoleosa]|uniref:Uncharacterized protein n=1 Tax=Camellia lanceoleosa TaxID=1840588 RepID=A0ACC0F5Z9_9ERIC|nr:hypothetical protein LOK49_LG15G02348 [Camellia lanceoleosa]